MITQIKALYKKVKDLELSSTREQAALPSACYFLEEDEIVCYPRAKGDGRHPYQYDGLTLWAHSSGNISVEESMFNIFLPSTEGREPYLAFFVGEQRDEDYFPVSITGVAKQPFEKNINRFTVYTPYGVYYFVETTQLIAVVFAFVDTKKRICFSLCVENKTEKDIETYLASYFNPHLRHNSFNGFEDKWYKSCKKTDYGFCFRVTECLSRENCILHYAALRSDADNSSATTSRMDFTGSTSASLNCSKSLQTGNFKNQQDYTEFIDTAIASEISKFNLSAKGVRQISYMMSTANQEGIAREAVVNECNLIEIFKEESKKSANLKAAVRNFRLHFSGLEGELLGKEFLLNNFLANVTRQVDFCSRSKNYAGEYIGVRDIMQQIEAAVYWDPLLVRRRIIETLNYISDDGRPPRQYSYQPSATVPPLMDLRAFIDQGVWIISTVYTYLSFTNDYSILEEICSYYSFRGLSMTTVGVRVNFSDRKDSVLEHLLAIADFLIGHIDAETGCLCALYGDWNDALDGLGKTQKQGKVFSNGVSVMASLQLYKNLNELIEILNKLKKYPEKVSHFKQVKEKLEEGLLKYAVVNNGTDNKILHGWGEERSWLVGSYCDHDGVSRDGLTSNAFWILSDLYKAHGEYIPDILNAYERLESKYGIKTFEPAFSITDDKVGRIIYLPAGTAENASTYNHSTCFAIWSLFEINEGERAWKNLYKLLPFNHRFITTTPFVMPNSFSYNEGKGFDGESMSDWFTGAGCVLLKLLLHGMLGIKTTLEGVRIHPVSYMPFKDMEMIVKIKNKSFRISYNKTGNDSRQFLVNGEVYQKEEIFFSDNDLTDEMVIEIFDY